MPITTTCSTQRTIATTTSLSLVASSSGPPALNLNSLTGRSATAARPVRLSFPTQIHLMTSSERINHCASLAGALALTGLSVALSAFGQTQAPRSATLRGGVRDAMGNPLSARLIANEVLV